MLGANVGGNSPTCQCCLGPEAHVALRASSFPVQITCLSQDSHWSASITFLREKSQKVSTVLPSERKINRRAEASLWRFGSSIMLNVKNKILKPAVLFNSLFLFIKAKGLTCLFSRTPNSDEGWGLPSYWAAEGIFEEEEVQTMSLGLLQGVCRVQRDLAVEAPQSAEGGDWGGSEEVMSQNGSGRQQGNDFQGRGTEWSKMSIHHTPKSHV